MTQAPPARRAGRNEASAPYRPPEYGGRYGALLLLLISSYLLSAFNVRLVADFDFVLFAAVLLLALRTAPYSRRTKLLVGTVALAGSVLVDSLTHTGEELALGAAVLWKALILLVSVVIIVRRVLAKPTVTIQSIYGALSAYIIIGLMFAAFFAAMQYISGVPFFAGGKPASRRHSSTSVSPR